MNIRTNLDNNAKEDLLIHYLENEYIIYKDECDLDEDRGIDYEDFAKYAKEHIEANFGIYMFDDYNIEAYAKYIAESKDQSNETFWEINND